MKINTINQTWVWLAQRLSAVVLAICSIVHIGGIIVAVQHGLTTVEITNRVGANIGWFLFYSIFIISAAIHAPLGLRNILSEMTEISNEIVNIFSLVFCLIILLLGLKTTWGFYTLESTL